MMPVKFFAYFKALGTRNKEADSFEEAIICTVDSQTGLTALFPQHSFSAGSPQVVRAGYAVSVGSVLIFMLYCYKLASSVTYFTYTLKQQT
jgi:hypothetical protein